MDIVKTVRVRPGRYVVAVSGGVDSMALLDILRRLPGLKLTVAHFDHGIRDASHFDRHLVAEVAHEHGLPFVYSEGRLGPDASEDEARVARYEFLRKIQSQTGSRAILTAHHQDDLLETAVHNILRGTGRKGLSSLRSTDEIIRPLLHLPKDRLRAYAAANGLNWAEDYTNADVKYRRNYIRHNILPAIKRSSPEGYTKLKALLKRQADINRAIDVQLQNILHTQPGLRLLRRHDVTMLPHNVGAELIAEWLRSNGKRQSTKRQIEKVLTGFKTAKPGTVLVLDKTSCVKFTPTLGKFSNGSV